MKLRDFIDTTKTPPLLNTYVMGYWESEIQPLQVIKRTIDEGHEVWGNETYRDFGPPTKWHKLPGGDDFNNATYFDDKDRYPVPDLDVTV